MNHSQPGSIAEVFLLRYKLSFTGWILILSCSRCHLPTLYIGMEYLRTHSYKLADQVTRFSILCSALKLNDLSFVLILYLHRSFSSSSFSCKQRRYALQIHLFITNSELLHIIWKSAFLFSLQSAYLIFPNAIYDKATLENGEKVTIQ